MSDEFLDQVRRRVFSGGLDVAKKAIDVYELKDSLPAFTRVLEAADKTIGELRAHLSEIRTVVNGQLDAESKIEAIRLVVGGGE